MKGKLRIREIAEATGLSSSTVSRVLSGKANVSDLARQTILAYAEQQGILADISHGRMLFSRLLVVHKRPRQKGDELITLLNKELRTAFMSYNVHVRFHAINVDNDKAVESARLHELTDFDAVIVCGVHTPWLSEFFNKADIPCLFIHEWDAGMIHDSLSPDYFYIGQTAASHLYDSGHREFLAIMKMGNRLERAKLIGVNSFLQSKGIDFSLLEHVRLISSMDEWLDEIVTMVNDSKNIPALIFNHTELARLTLNRLKQLNVTHRVSLISIDPYYDNSEITSVTVPLSCIAQEALLLIRERAYRPEAPARRLLLSGSLNRHGSVNLKS